MEKQNPAFIGIDPTAGRQPFTFAALDQECHLLVLSAGDFDELFAFMKDHPANVVAVNAPPRPNHGLVRRSLEKQHLPQGQLRGSDLRLAENDLRERGISVSPTPSRVEMCPTWMQMSFDLYRRLDEAGYRQYPSEQAPHQWVETHPHAAFCVLLERIPLPKPTIEGRLQRQGALFEKGVGIRDPMEFFEEITRHKLLQGFLPMEIMYAPEALDALVAAYMAWCVVNCSQETILVGDAEEGRIALPVARLKEKYN
jgi:hypothetical protein